MVSPTLIDSFLTHLKDAFQQKGFRTHQPYRIGDLTVNLCVQSPRPVGMGFSRVDDHFLFIPLEEHFITTEEQLKALYRRISKQINQGYKTPHALRMRIPNLVIAAISTTAFSNELLSFARYSTFVPWYGGEVGQLMLINLATQEITSLLSHQAGRYPVPGAFPLQHASRMIREYSRQAFEQDKA